MADPTYNQQPVYQQPAYGQYDQRPAAPGDWAIPQGGEGQPLLQGQQYYGGSQNIKDAMMQDRQAFVQKVYGILSVQLGLTFGIALPIATADMAWLDANRWLMYVAYAGLVIMLCSMCCFQPAMRTFPTNYGFLGLMTASMAILVGFASASYTWQSVALAVSVTAAIFLLMTLYACNTSRDFTGSGPYLFAVLCALTLFSLIVIVLSAVGIDVSWLVLFLDLVGVLLFTFYIIYDTQLILGGKHEAEFSIDDYTFAALSLYLDVMNLFLHILSLLGDRK